MKHVKPPLKCAATEIEITLDYEGAAGKHVASCYQWTGVVVRCWSHASRRHVGSTQRNAVSSQE